MEIKPFPRPDWSPLPEKEGIRGVEGQVLLVDRRAVVATLRFSEHAQTDVHPADHDIHVLVLEGSGFSFCGGETEPVDAGQSVLWPKGTPHNLFTRDSTMTTLMVEHVGRLPGRD
ncbi:MAG: cupin domain-containing protein [Gammaproteobacteria bacterium]